MTRFREHVRAVLPFSTDIYEFAIAKKQMYPSKKKFLNLLDRQAPICLDLGGADPGKGEWTTVDMTQKCDIYWDLRLPIPLSDNSVSKIYSSHLFEHLTHSQGQALFKESIRLLKPGGTFSIGFNSDSHSSTEQSNVPNVAHSEIQSGLTLNWCTPILSCIMQPDLLGIVLKEQV